MRLCTAALVLTLAASAFAQDGPEGPAFVEIVADRDAYFVGESFTVTIRVGIEAAFLEESAIQPFRRELQVPVQIEAPWFDELPGVSAWKIRGVRAGSGRKLALNEDVTTAYPRDAEEIGRRTFRMFDVDRRVVAGAPGVLEIPAPRLRLAYATKFEETFVEGRVPVDRHDVTVEGTGLVVDILPLPDEGRPAGFAGIVGRCSVSASVETATVDAGVPLRLTLHVDGASSPIAAPRLDDLDGLHVLGVIQEGRKGGQMFVYDLSIVHHVEAVPAISLPYFDPAPPGRYAMARTDPIPISVTGAVEPPEPSDVGGADAPARRVPVSGFSPSTIAAMVVGAALLVLCHFLAFWFLLSRRARAAKARVASETVGEDAPDGADPAEALAAFLAARLGCESAAVISPDLPERLTSAGIPTPLAQRTSQTLERLVAARYGGAAPDDATNIVRTLVADLDAALGSRD